MVTIQRRKEHRVNVNIPVPINKIIFNNKDIIGLNKRFPANIYNISSGGVLLQSSLSVPINLKFVFDLIDENNKILCFLEIVRKEKCDGDYYYGCKLKSVFEGDRERLGVFILKKQVQNLKCMKNFNEDQKEKII